MNKTVLNYLRAGTAGIYLVSHEEARAESEMLSTAQALGYAPYVWSVTEGIAVVTQGAGEIIPDTQEPGLMLAAFAKLPEKSLLLARDFHAFLGGPHEPASPLLVRQLRDVLALGKQSQRALVILGCQLRLPPELGKEIVVVEFKLPDRAQLETVLRGIAGSAGLELNADAIEPLVDAASGLTTGEAENAYALAVVESDRTAISPAVVQREKSLTVRKHGLLEIIEGRTRLDDIGGLDCLKADLFGKRHLFTRAAREYGLPTPRGLLVVGQPGTGKSLSAAATASIFGLPLLRLEAGRLFGSLVGESERNWRTAYATVRAVSPCILWIDEVDGLFSGGAGGGSSDGGTTQRVLKSILQDMQFNGEGVFFMLTANDIDRLPDPLIDRLDVWSVDLPSGVEREAIWKIHIAKRGREPEAFDLGRLAALTDGYSGRQIEQVFLKALKLAFNDGAREPRMADCEAALVNVVPTSRTMAGQIEARRARLAGRAQPASAAEDRPTQGRPGSRKLA